VYDGDNRRAIKTTSAGTTYYFYDPAGRLLTELTPGEEMETGDGKDYVYLPDGPIARIDWSVQVNPCPPHSTICPPSRIEVETPYYYHTDHLGTPIAMTDDGGAFKWRAEHLPFGELFSNGETTVENNLRFPGQYFDWETGLHQNWFRDYSASSGRYLQSDPIGLAGGANPYAYVQENPTGRIDQTGRLMSFRLPGMNWCGPGWTGGRWEEYAPEHDKEYLPPTSDLDAACMKHDKCYYHCRVQNNCDVAPLDQCTVECDITLADDYAAAWPYPSVSLPTGPLPVCFPRPVQSSPVWIFFRYGHWPVTPPTQLQCQ
jgi:RHS repeat-associated protein